MANNAGKSIVLVGSHADPNKLGLNGFQAFGPFTWQQAKEYAVLKMHSPDVLAIPLALYPPEE